MSDKFAPIYLKDPRLDHAHEITSVTEALGYIHGLWPRHPNSKRETAEQICRQALAGDISTEEARELIYQTAMEADLLEGDED
ncbi:DUF982 domain-containing protein [Phyllobacterium ifriqiyense]|uniref:DUF982 domain-containing protein n=1 Tax=Phyllobacterium ifriqiyense TaxID=314238 RepID=UPI003398F578